MRNIVICRAKNQIEIIAILTELVYYSNKKWEWEYAFHIKDKAVEKHIPTALFRYLKTKSYLLWH